MKRIIAILLAFMTVTAVFASCSRRDQFRPDETDASTGEQTTVAGQPGVNNPGESNPTDTNQSGGDVTDPNTTTPDIPIGDPSTGDAENGKITGNPYEGWTAEELYASFMEDQERSVYNNTNDIFGNTPYYVILDVQYGGSMFSKLTGQVVKICKDPLCDHEDCIFSNSTVLMRSCQVVDDRCYVVVTRSKEGIRTTCMYSFDLLMTDAKLVCEWSGADSPKKVYIYKDKLYYSVEMKFDDGQYGKVTMVYDMKEKTTSPLREEPVRCSVILHQGAYEWYTVCEDGSLRRYNLDTGKDEVIVGASHLNPEAGEMEFRFLGVSGQTVYVRKVTIGQDVNMFQYDMGTGKLQEIEGSAPLIYDGTCYQQVRHDVDAYKDDPHYEYYCNDNDVATRYGGKYFRVDTETGELHEIVSLSTDGIPDSITDLIFLDKKFLMIQYQTYKDFLNPYSPMLKEWDESRRYVVVDMETGTVYELGVDLANQKVQNPSGR
ncbi:MAG: hypothetical protein IJ363_12080 [Clostridia bacterium]|nr:hypothetical protein [Clostridia bacterium]